MKSDLRVEYLPSGIEPTALNRDAHVAFLAQQLFDFMQAMEIGEIQIEFPWHKNQIARFSALIEVDETEVGTAEAGAQRRPGG